jgi:polyphosphate glucokinase
LDRLGKKRWRKHVFDVVDRLVAALEPDDVVLGGGNARILKELPPGRRLGDNANAFRGGFLMWEDPPRSELPAVQVGPAVATKLRAKVKSKRS